MSESKEMIEFSYGFVDADDGFKHEVRSAKSKECIGADEVCEMFLDFMRSAGYSEQNVWDYFQNR